MTTKIQTELEKLTRLQPKTGEAPETYTRRVMKKVNALADQDAENWECLSDEAQTWMNDNTEADNSGAELQLLEVPVVETEPAPTAEEAPPLNESDEVSTVKTTKAKKAPAKKAPAPAKKVAAAPKAAKKAPPAKKAKVTNGNGTREHRPGRRPLFPDNGVITLLKEANPHRAGSIRDKAFRKMKNGMTVQQAVAAGVPRQQVWSHWKRGVIAVEA